MAIRINSKSPGKSIWKFFVGWLGLLKGPNPARAFELIDGPVKGHQALDIESFRDLLKEFSGDPKETNSPEDILLEGDVFDACSEDADVSTRTDGSYYALLSVPLRQASGVGHELVLGFHFIPSGDDSFSVLLNDEPLVL